MFNCFELKIFVSFVGLHFDIKHLPDFSLNRSCDTATKIIMKGKKKKEKHILNPEGAISPIISFFPKSFFY